MAYSYDPNLDPDKDNQQNQSAPQLASGSQAAGGSSSTQAATQPGAQTHSGNYQNLNSYLDANQNSDFGNQFVSKINNSVQGANDAQSQAEQGFKQKSDAAAIKYNQGTVDNALNDPYAYSQDPNNVQAFQNQLNAQYKGPQSYADDGYDYQKAQGATQKANDEAGAAQSEGGRFALLNNYFGNSNYNQGQKSLDNLLLQGNDQTQQGINQAKENSNQASRNFQNQQNSLQNYAGNNIAATQETAQKTKAAGDTALSGYGDTINNQEKGYTDKQNEITSIQNALQNRQMQSLTPEEIKQLGVQSHTATYGANPLDYLKSDQLSKEGFVDPEVYKKYNALNGLMGETNTLGLNEANVGTNIGKPGYSFDKTGFQQAADQGKARYQRDFGNVRFDPFSSAQPDDEWNSPRGWSIDPNDPASAQKVIQQEMIASPNSAPNRQAQLQKIQAKIDAMNKIYGVNDYLGS